MTDKINSLLEKVGQVFPPPDVDDEYVRKHFDGFTLIEPENRLPSMLSAYLKVALEQFSPENEVAEFLAYALSPDKDWKEKSNWWCRRLSVLNENQITVILDYLYLMENDPRFEYIFDQIKRAQPRLRKLWNMTKSNHVAVGDAEKHAAPKR
jgi:hypothetical protein